MFGTKIFETWPAVLTGAGCFGALYGLVVLMSDKLMFDMEGVSWEAAGITMLAFVGYIGVALLIRQKPSE